MSQYTVPEPTEPRGGGVVVCAAEPFLHPELLLHLSLCPEPPTSCPSLNRGTRVRATLGTSPRCRCCRAPLPARGGFSRAGMEVF